MMILFFIEVYCQLKCSDQTTRALLRVAFKKKGLKSCLVSFYRVLLFFFAIWLHHLLFTFCITVCFCLTELFSLSECSLWGGRSRIGEGIKEGIRIGRRIMERIRRRIRIGGNRKTNPLEIFTLCIPTDYKKMSPEKGFFCCVEPMLT